MRSSITATRRRSELLRLGLAEGRRRGDRVLEDTTPFLALEFATVGATSGTTPGPPIEDMVKRITSPLLLVAAGPDEKDAGELYDRAAGDRPVDVWYLPDVGHTAAVRQAAAEYEQRVTAFFDDALPGP